MAIRRCPYCKAIIDEQDKYCNNCGTQLLFPEDEFVEEEIPGDKIIDDEEEGEEKEEELLEEDSEEAEPAVRDLEEEGETEDTDEEEEEKKEEGDSEGLDEPEEIEEEGGLEKGEPEEEDEDGDEDEEEELEEKTSEHAKKYEVSIEKDELVFKTKDLDNLTRTVDEGKEDLEEFLENFEEKGEESKVPTSDTKEELPPWVSGIKGGAPLSELEEEEEEQEEEEEEQEEEEEEQEEEEEEGEGEEEEEGEKEEIEKEEEEEETTGETEEQEPPARAEWSADSGIGIPERVTQTQSGLPFSDTAAQAEAEEQRVTADEEGGEEGEVGREPRRWRGFSFRLKSKLIDLIFITALWLISLWFTSQVIGVSFFRLISGSPLPVLAFYLILMLLYFFLFLYFLGETLGDHYFPDGD